MTASTRTFSDRFGKYITSLLPVVSIGLTLLAGEIAVRAWHFARWDVSFLEGQPRSVRGLSPITVDDRLGWRATPSYRFEGTKHTSDGTEYPAKISQNAEGFRVFGDLVSGRPRVFVIGDSFTQAIDASDDKTYYADLQSSLGVEVFAYGGGGYGSLQEFMILDKYYDVVKPDLVIWQYSRNDLINNSLELETASSINNNDMVRPYLVTGIVRSLLPKNQATALREVALRDCRVCYILLNRYGRLRAMINLVTVERKTSPGGSANGLFVQAATVTDEIMRMVRQRVGSVPVVGFIVGSGYPYGPEYVDALTQISKRHDIVLVDVESAVLQAEEHGRNVRAADGGHWNEVGHSIAGQALRQSLQKSGLLPHVESGSIHLDGWPRLSGLIP